MGAPLSAAVGAKSTSEVAGWHAVIRTGADTVVCSCLRGANYDWGAFASACAGKAVRFRPRPHLAAGAAGP